MPPAVKPPKPSMRRGAKAFWLSKWRRVGLSTPSRSGGRRRHVLCLGARPRTRWGEPGDDFEKGEADGTKDALAVLETVVGALAASYLR